MKLTKKKAIEITIEKWTCLAETGLEGWPEGEKYGDTGEGCALCEYAEECDRCPYFKKFGFCDIGFTPWRNWYHSEDMESRKKYASELLEQVKALL